MAWYRWAVVLACLYSFIAFAFAFQIVPPLISTLIAGFQLSNAQAGLLMSVVLFPGIFLALPAGIFIDRFGVKLTGLISAISMALGCVVTAFANSFGIFLVGRFFLGIGGAFAVTTMPSIISQWFSQKELGKPMGIYGTGMPIASSAAFAVASFLMVNYEWQYSLYASALLAIVNVLVFSLIVREGPLKEAQHEKSAPREALTNVEAWKAGLIWLLFNISVMSFTTWAPKIFHETFQMDSFYASFLASMVTTVQIFFVPLFGYISDRTGRRRPFMILGALLAVGLFVAVAFSSSTFVLLIVVGLGIAASLLLSVVNLLPPDILGSRLAGTGFGILAICSSSSVVIGPPLIGFVLDMSNSVFLSFVAMAVFSVMATIVAYALKTK